jgi:hypothetical protein
VRTERGCTSFPIKGNNINKNSDGSKRKMLLKYPKEAFSD